MPFAEDLAVFFNEADFADPAVLDGVPVSVIFHSGYDEAFALEQHEAWAQLPAVLAAGVTQASVLVVRSTTYRVRVSKPDGTGVCTLLLERQ